MKTVDVTEKLKFTQKQLIGKVQYKKRLIDNFNLIWSNKIVQRQQKDCDDLIKYHRQ